MVLEIIAWNIEDDLNQISAATNEFLQKQLSQENWKKTTVLFDLINTDIDNVINSPEQDIRSMFENTMRTFGEKVSSFSTILLESMNGDISKVLESDRYAFSRVDSIINKNYTEIGKERVTMISDILQRWIDYSAILSINLIRSMGQLSNALQKIDSEELSKSINGTLLSLSCIFRMLRNDGRDTKKLDLFIKIGCDYSGALESYSDTIDILCSSEETEMINRIGKD